MNRLKSFFWAFVALKLIDVYVAEECNSAYVTCINCSQYQICINGSLQNVYEGGRECNDPVLKKCQALLNCHTVIAYAIANDECTDIGIFRNKISESKFFVCLSDSNSGFVKLDFSCFDDEYFDELNLQCEPKAFTVSGNQTATATTVADTENVTAVTEETASSTDEDEFTMPAESLTTDMDLTDALTTEIVVPSESTEKSQNTTVTTDVSSEEVSTPKTTTAVSDDSDNSTTSPELPGEPSQSPTTSTVSTASSAPVCTTSGIFPDPVNCKGYYRCSTTLVKFDYLCPGISYFNEIEMKCSLIMTPSCLNQTLLNSTTTSPSALTKQSTFPTATTTNSSIPDFPFGNTTSFVTTTTTITTTLLSSTSTQKTPSTPSVTPKPDVTFKCPGPGVFADPTNCKTYYRCSTTNVPFTYRCPGETYFNSFTQKCGTKMPSNCL